MLCLLLVGRGKKREMVREHFFPQGRMCLANCAVWDFCICWVQLKADLRVILRILCVPSDGGYYFG
jgi:hypothetical protein